LQRSDYAVLLFSGITRGQVLRFFAGDQDSHQAGAGEILREWRDVP